MPDNAVITHGILVIHVILNLHLHFLGGEQKSILIVFS